MLGEFKQSSVINHSKEFVFIANESGFIKLEAMKSVAVLDDIRSRIESGYPLLFLKTPEEERWERKLAELALEMERGLVTWTITRGLQPPASADQADSSTANQLLDQLSGYPEDHLFLVKDFHPYLTDPLILRQIRDLLPVLTSQRKSLLLFGPVAQIPLELEKDAVKVELPLPDYQDLREEFDQTIAAMRGQNTVIPALSEDDEDRLIKATMGLTANESHKAWRRAIGGQAEINDDVFTTLIAEKRTLASGSDFLEFYDLEENVADIGGLDQLKDWMSKRAEAYSPRAREQGVPLPKGMLLLGVQGCGKSLTARATARLLSFPLIRLDIAALLGAQRGESEKNMRNVLDLTESIAPAVLWLDEIEKGFAGVENDTGGSSDATMTRLVGTFLTWMSEIQKPIFVVATANSVESLPPEMLRRGRFDELFFVDLPNFDERKFILEIHLKKRGWKPEQFDVNDLAQPQRWVQWSGIGTDRHHGADRRVRTQTSAVARRFGTRLENDRPSFGDHGRQNLRAAELGTGSVPTSHVGQSSHRHARGRRTNRDRSLAGGRPGI